MNKRHLWWLCSFMIASTVLIVAACKKDLNATNSTDANSATALASLQSWYKSNYSVSTVNSNKDLNALSTEAKDDLTQIIKPNWNSFEYSKKLGIEYYELPLDSAVKLGVTPTNNTGDFDFKSNRSKTSFLFVKTGETYAAYLMTVIGDSSYLKNDYAKLAKNTFKQHETDFSGKLLYFTPQGKLVYGWLYKDGKITGAYTTAANQVQTVKTTSTQSLKSTQSICSYYTIFLGGVCAYNVCTYTYEQFTICTDDTTPMDHVPDPSGADYPPPSTTTSTIITTPTPPTPCITSKALATNATFITKLQALEAKVNQNYEATYTFTDPSDASTYTYQQGNANEASMETTVSTSISGVIHSHQSGAIDPTDGSAIPTSSTPTPGDFEAIYQWYTAGKMIDPSTFTFGVVTSQSTTYIVLINDKTLFSSWGATNLTTSSSQHSTFYNNASSTGLSYLNAGKSNIEAHELSLLDNLQNSGLTLLRGNFTNLNSWVPLSSNNGNITTNPCN